MFERSFARDAAIIRVGENRTNHFLGVAALTQDCRAARGVLFGGTVGVVGPAFVIEIVQESGEAPKILVRAGLPSIGTHAGFDGQSVFAQAFVLPVFTQKSPGVISRWQSWHCVLLN